MTTHTLSHSDIIRIIQSGGCQAISLDIVTDPKMRKTANPFLGAMKHNTVSGLVGFKYGNSVNNQAGREDNEADMDFVAQPRKWGERVGHMVEHKGQWYVELKVQSTNTPTFWKDGKQVTGEDLESLKTFIPTKRAPSTQDHLETKVIVRDIKLSSIQRIRIGGVTLDVTPTGEMPAVEAEAPERTGATVPA